MNADKLKKLRENKGYTQQQLADIVKVRREFINAIENGRRRPSLAVLEQIAVALDCSLKDFF